jgi:RNA polymerase sigma factor (sigma-70 family)
MLPEENHPKAVQNTQAQFNPTQWTVVLAAGGSSPEAQEGLNQLCQTYWYPLYAFVRRQGHDSHAAKDLTQSFFVHLLENDLVKKVDRRKGRFRSFLLTSLSNFMRDEWRKEQAVMRGGGRKTISIDEIEAEEKYRMLPAHQPDSAQVFDRSWAVTVVENAKQKLKQEYATQESVFTALEPYLSGESSRGFYAELAKALNKDENAIGVLLHRMRKDFGRLLLEVISQTVADPSEVEDELRYLMEAWGGGGPTRQG